MKISETAWRKGWRREAAATQAAALEVATIINWLHQEQLNDAADIIRRVAMRQGVRETAKNFAATLRKIRIREAVSRA